MGRKAFQPEFWRLNRDAKLIVAGKIYQTLPLYEIFRLPAFMFIRKPLTWRKRLRT